MDNRRFKVYGQAYAEQGDVVATLTIAGQVVFDGPVLDSTTVRDGQPRTSNLLFEYELPVSQIGKLSYSLAISGGELCLGRTQYNLLPVAILNGTWIDQNTPDLTNISTSAQTHLATELGEDKLGSDIYNALIAGSLTSPSDEQLQIMIKANTTIGPIDVFKYDNDDRRNALIDGEEIEGWAMRWSPSWWPIIDNGSAFTCIWNLDPSVNILGNTTDPGYQMTYDEWMASQAN